MDAMTTVTIPKEMIENKDLVAVPRRAYKEFLAWQKKIKSVKTFTPSAAEKRAFALGRKNFAKGNYLTIDEL